VALFKEEGPDEVDVSFRSMDDTDCTVVALKFGGGHNKAASYTVHAPLPKPNVWYWRK